MSLSGRGRGRGRGGENSSNGSFIPSYEAVLSGGIKAASYTHQTAQQAWSAGEQRDEKSRVQAVVDVVKACLPASFSGSAYESHLDVNDERSIVNIPCPEHVNISEIMKSVMPLGYNVTLERHPADTEARILSLSRRISLDRSRLLNWKIVLSALCATILLVLCMKVLFTRVGKYQNASAVIQRHCMDAWVSLSSRTVQTLLIPYRFVNSMAFKFVAGGIDTVNTVDTDNGFTMQH